MKGTTITRPPASKGRWGPGQSGNPSGRPAGLADVRAAARAYTQEALDTLASVIRDAGASPAARVAAATALLDRGWGRPEQAVAITSTATDAPEGDRVLALREAAVAALAALAGRAALSPTVDAIARPDAPTAPGGATPARPAQADPPAPPDKP